MKNFFQFAFSFLYTRNWHTGRKELSQSRLVVFACGAVLLVVSLITIGFLQAPVEAVIITR
ncbi:MAG: hypothetical protein ACI9SY_000474 [Candidatus Paceibacteria bacterium]|jgi:hypothetical protein